VKRTLKVGAGTYVEARQGLRNQSVSILAEYPAISHSYLFNTYCLARDVQIKAHYGNGWRLNLGFRGWKRAQVRPSQTSLDESPRRINRRKEKKTSGGRGVAVHTAWRFPPPWNSLSEQPSDFCDCLSTLFKYNLSKGFTLGGVRRIITGLIITRDTGKIRRNLFWNPANFYGYEILLGNQKAKRKNNQSLNFLQ